MRAVVVPAAPALLPGIGGAADPLADLRERARALVADTMTKGVTRLVVIGAARSTQTWPSDAPSGAARFTTGRAPEGALPTDLEIGRLFAPSAGGEPVLQSIAADAHPADCLELGRSLADEETLLLVVADGPATLTEKAPGHLQPDAAPFADELGRALAAADTTALADLDPTTCDRLWMRGRPALQVLAGAFTGERVHGEVLAEESPFGVQYLLARWSGK
ncbi:hypothetical protein O9K63_14290 [Janibacter cremeus]|uniref:hypothetical protein n=1 Tax=Janibacter cremeus TaxID=1285192 RepID=UPI0023F7056D|nr:hypothetical protein [Janibacter cremeus]WEV77746.1 hypothetical protein O9K63_14290 [Janibacter cremeus]